MEMREAERLEPGVRESEVRIVLDPFVLDGTLTLPTPATAVILFAHGSGSSRFSPRNRAVASELHAAKMGTLLLDLLTSDEELVDSSTRQHRFDIELLAGRVVVAIDWLREDPRTKAKPIGLFGASTGAAAALIGAAERPREVGAVVSRGGRVDLAGPALASVHAPTLFIVGSKDREVLELNQEALEDLASADKQLFVVPGASHLFEERGALSVVAEQTRVWFGNHLF
jgi:putative phosphoribosyl transferase